MERAKWIGIAVVVTLFVVIVLQNWDDAEIDILFFSPITLPLAPTLLGALAVGYVTGMIVGNPMRFLRKKTE